MIKYKIDLIQSLKESGYSTYKIRKEKTFTESQLQQMRTHRLLTQDALNKLSLIASRGISWNIYQMEHKQITNHHRNNKEGLAEMQGFSFALSPNSIKNIVD